MTDTPMTPERERTIRIWHEELHGLTDRTAVARREALGDLLAEVDRLRGELSDATAELAENARAMNVLCRHRETAEARVAELEALKPARFQDCQACGASYEYGHPCSACEFKKQMADVQAGIRDALPCALSPEQARRIEQERPETNTAHDCNLPLVRRLDCGHCPHEICQDCDRSPHTCRCAEGGT
ncbi:hypothetical protein EES43_24520 [Streptomyces sp. ADI96-02]|uniref:hypothetical protein n=1 Tax=Streptomyces sp. ADI96-02 TaxID=1522760 RepID=UPI000F554EC5|nr:hypothetical protein [Streptomyces sp. ADI96-02]RPK56210.1 hypothetical protein EES43_24520 [Streptomyces sp. ADI96-02]